MLCKKRWHDNGMSLDRHVNKLYLVLSLKADASVLYPDEDRGDRASRIPPPVRWIMVRLWPSLPDSTSHHWRLRGSWRHSFHVPRGRLCQRCQNLPQRHRAHTQNRQIHACHWPLGSVCEPRKILSPLLIRDVALSRVFELLDQLSPGGAWHFYCFNTHRIGRGHRMEVTGAFGSGFDFFVFLIVTFSVLEPSCYHPPINTSGLGTGRYD